jgi:hypothetical protein
LRKSKKGGDSWVVYRTLDGDRIRFRAEDARAGVSLGRGRNYTVDAKAGLNDNGDVFVYEGRHRTTGAAHGDSIPSDLGGVEGQPGVLDFEYNEFVTTQEGLPIRDMTIDYDQPDLSRVQAMEAEEALYKAGPVLDARTRFGARGR